MGIHRRRAGVGRDASETVEPVLDQLRDTALGVRHEARVTDASGSVRVSGLLDMYAGADDCDRIEIHGQPTLRAEFLTGVPGEAMAVTATFNAAAAASGAPAHWSA